MAHSTAFQRGGDALERRGFQSSVAFAAGLGQWNVRGIVPVPALPQQVKTPVYQDFEDKNWSFTDCVSRVVMERLDIQTAFALDDDFRQFGTVVVVPNRP